MHEPSSADEVVTAGEETDDRAVHWVPAVVALAGIVAVALLAWLCHQIADDNEQELLERQTEQAGALLSVSVSQFQAPLVGVARAARATDGDAATFQAMVVPLMAESEAYGRFVLLDAGSAAVLAEAGPPAFLVDEEPDRVAKTIADAKSEPFAVVDLLARDRTLGYAVADDPDAPRYVVYTERALNPDPNVRRRTDEPFSQLAYALYLGPAEVDAALLGASGDDLPLTGRRATTTIPYGDTEILLVTSPLGRLGSDLTNDLWWIVLLSGGVATLLIVALLRRYDRSRRKAIVLAAELARRHEEQRDVAETLQLGLLPERLTPPPGTRLASRYWPAAPARLIGGDLYDVFRIDERRWGILIGDVCGKGIEAAALTGLIRHTARTASRYCSSPAEVLEAIHLAMKQHQPSTFCTVCFVTYAPDDAYATDAAHSGGTLLLSLGGHPQPLLAHGDGSIEAIGVPGTLLGLIEPTVVDEERVVRPSDTLVLFTDGLTDAPADEAVALEEVRALLGRAEASDIDWLADAIHALEQQRRPTGSGDDTALLVLRFGPDSPGNPPARPTAAVRTLARTPAAG